MGSRKWFKVTGLGKEDLMKKLVSPGYEEDFEVWVHHKPQKKHKKR
jgi:hypothetical protein